MLHSITRTLIVYSTVDGHTLKICQRIRQSLKDHGHQLTLISVEEGLELDCSEFDSIVIGASIRYGKHRPFLYEFIARHHAVLTRMPSAFFSVSAVARKAGKDTPAGNAYFRKFVHKANWSPRLAAIFAGKIDYSRYRFIDKQMIRFIMWMTNGPTAPDAVVEFTDWNAVDAFALQISRLR
ncbi:protoporphyrinogen oxidase [Oxalicibacterium flavum]|uniref:Protoporphyrinogen IX dehydrogenase [quinone] n=1 Tax=Oxalicibacterium flavum TaxID=179467 RepID=A0A8J2XXD7_9BURK|nr:menaquinone-dependent protoporphyrinogen IX dehydrogenase [Oxalicibacterium flavum]GGC09395.1 protoporphyrinogen oxidase [Oxalicibacterium flavum]